MEWFDEKIEYIDGDRFLYKIVCFFLGGFKKRLTYKELYILLYQLNKHKLGEEKSKKKSMQRILKIYSHFHNNEIPNVEEI
jgi:fructosamine-3-kinase